MNRKNFRRRACDDNDDGDAGDSVTVPSSSKPKRGTPLLSFAAAEEEENTEPKGRKKGFGTSHGLGHQMAASSGGPREKRAAFSNVLPRAGEYTPERLQELQKNTIKLKVPPPAPAAEAEGVVLKGVLKPSHGDHVAEVHELQEQAQESTSTVNVDATVLEDAGLEDDIPDASRIAAAKAQRERRRKASAAPDYIPLRTSDAPLDEEAPSKRGEVVSSDDEDEVRGRLAFLATNGSREAGVFQFRDEKLSSAKDEEEEDEETKWEEEQLRKGAGILRGDEAAAVRGALPSSHSTMPMASMPSRVQHVETLSVAQQAESILISLREGLKKQQESYGRTKSELSLTEQRMSASEANIGTLQKNIGVTSEKFVYMQKLRDYISDLCEFLKAKGPLIEELEEEMKKLHENRAGAIFERRLSDDTDEMTDAHVGVGAAMTVLNRGGTIQMAAAQASNAIAAASAVGLTPQLDEFGRDVNGKIKLRADARRRRAAKAVKAGVQTDRVENESTSEESDSGEDAYNSGRREVLETGKRIFSDASEEFSELKLVKQRLEEWKQRYSGAYTDAYMPISAPQIFAPYVRLELLNWDPLYSDRGLETMQWYPALFNYGATDDDDDPDSNLLPTLVEKVALPILHHQVAHCWDRLSTRATQNAVASVQEILVYVPASSEALQELLNLVKTRLAESVSAMELPAWKIEVTTAVPQAARIAAHRFGTALRLLRCIGLWKDVLASPVLEHLAFQELVHAKIVPYLRTLLPSMDDAVTMTERVVAALTSGFNVGESRHKLVELVQVVNMLASTESIHSGRISKMLLKFKP